VAEVCDANSVADVVTAERRILREDDDDEHELKFDVPYRPSPNVVVAENGEVGVVGSDGSGPSTASSGLFRVRGRLFGGSRQAFRGRFGDFLERLGAASGARRRTHTHTHTAFYPAAGARAALARISLPRMKTADAFRNTALHAERQFCV
jgi:hypothetical protein